MLVRLLLLRLAPLAALHFCKERDDLKKAVIVIFSCYGISFLIAVWKLFEKEKWMGILYLQLAIFPHYICYGFAAWMIFHCIFGAWSLRVWKRIYGLSMVCTFLGIFAESYWNPGILQFFLEIFK